MSVTASQVCGKLTVAGGRCRNPARSCTANHPAGMTADPPSGGKVNAGDDPFAGAAVVANAAARSEAGDLETDPDRLAELACHADAAVRVRVAGNPETPTEALDGLLDRLDPTRVHDITTAVAKNPAAGAGTLSRLAGSVVMVTRRAVAGNPACPSVVLEGLASDEKWPVRFDTANHPLTPPGVLLLLTADPDSTVRSAATRNPSTPKAGKSAAGLLAG